MKLATAIDQLSNLDDDLCIFARRPWLPDSAVVVSALAAGFQTPRHVIDQELDCFLEVHVAKEVLEVFGSRKPTQDECHRLLIFFAENDAYPNWVYD